MLPLAGGPGGGHHRVDINDVYFTIVQFYVNI